MIDDKMVQILDIAPYKHIYRFLSNNLISPLSLLINYEFISIYSLLFYINIRYTDYDILVLQKHRNENRDIGVISYSNRDTMLNGLNTESPFRIDLAQYAYSK